MFNDRKISRRRFLHSVGTAGLGASIIASPQLSMAASALKGTQAPGYFRFKLGGFEITVLTDGLNTTPLRFSASNIPEEELRAYLEQNHLPTETRQSHLNVCLVNTGDKLVLVDAGSGDNFRDTAGKLTASLEAAGYAAEDVDAVVITHGHPDHIWGIIDDFAEEPRFPNATYHINETEWDYWTADDLETKLPEGFKFFGTGAKRNLMPVAELTTRHKAEASVLPGITTIATPGHTLGHISVVVESEGKSLLITGDAITHPLISLEHPEWQPQMDMDKEVAVTTRKRLLDMASKDRMIVASYHIPFPGVGRIAATGNGYRWVPTVWQWEL